MTNISTDTATGVPDFPMTRAPGCPFAPPPKVLALNAAKQLSRVRIWDGSTPWLIHGYDAIRALFTDSRTSVDDRLPGYPHWNEGMLATVHKRPRSVFTSDAEEHTRFRRMLSKPFTFKRVEALRPAVQKITDDHIDALLAGPKPGDIVSTVGAADPVAGHQSSCWACPTRTRISSRSTPNEALGGTRPRRTRRRVPPRWRSTSPS